MKIKPKKMKSSAALMRRIFFLHLFSFGKRDDYLCSDQNNLG